MLQRAHIVSAVQASIPEALAPDTHLRMRGTLRSEDLERQFRQSRLEEDLSTAKLVLIVTTLGVLTFALNDHRLFGASTLFFVLAGIRFGLFALSITVWTKLNSATRQLCPEKFDLALLVWGIVLALIQTFVGYTRPESYSTHFLIHLFTVILAYCVVPLPMLKQTILALLVSLGMIVCMLVKPPAHGLTAPALIWTLLSANVLGASISRQLDRSRRMHFVSLKRETQARIGLESALAELQALRGIIPICTHCKNIRDDAGSWHRLEEYISSHSGAEFSHGFCPLCIEKYYSES